MIRDLFGEVPVTHQDIDAWLLAVPRIQPGTRRAANYVQEYSVVEKIKAAKLSGRFDQICAPRETACANWLERFSWVIKQESAMATQRTPATGLAAQQREH